MRRYRFNRGAEDKRRWGVGNWKLEAGSGGGVEDDPRLLVTHGIANKPPRSEMADTCPSAQQSHYLTLGHIILLLFAILLDASHDG